MTDEVGLGVHFLLDPFVCNIGGEDRCDRVGEAVGGRLI